MRELTEKIVIEGKRLSAWRYQNKGIEKHIFESFARRICFYHGAIRFR